MKKEYIEWMGRCGITDDYIDDLIEEGYNTDEILQKVYEDWEDVMKPKIREGYNFKNVFNHHLKGDLKDYIDNKIIPILEDEIKTEKNIIRSIEKTFWVDADNNLIANKKIIGKVSKINNSEGVITRYKKFRRELTENQKIRLYAHIENVKTVRSSLSYSKIKKYQILTEKQQKRLGLI